MCVSLYRYTVGESDKQAESGSLAFFLFRSKIPLYLNLLSPDKNTYSEKLCTHSHTHSAPTQVLLSLSPPLSSTHTHKHTHLSSNHTLNRMAATSFGAFLFSTLTRLKLQRSIYSFLSLSLHSCLHAHTHTHMLSPTHTRAHTCSHQHIRAHTHMLLPTNTHTHTVCLSPSLSTLSVAVQL